MNDDPKRGGDLLMTTGKLLAVMTAELGLVTWIFVAIVTSKVDTVRQEELAFRQMYELRHQEHAEDIRRVSEKASDLAARVEALDKRVLELERPVLRKR